MQITDYLPFLAARLPMNRFSRQPTTIMAGLIGLVASSFFSCAPVHAVDTPYPRHPELITSEFNAFEAPAKRKASSSPTPSPTATSPSTPATSEQVEQVITFMMSKVGVVPYQSGGTGNPGYDCSGLVQAAWKSAGITLPRTSGMQYISTTRVASGDLRRGDLLFYGPNGSQHVALYLGNNQLVEAANPNSGIRVATSTWSWYVENFAGAGRVAVTR